MEKPSSYCQGERCGMCWRDEHKLAEASHKVSEVIFDDMQQRHPLTQYVCDKHFNRIMGNFKGLFNHP